MYTFLEMLAAPVVQLFSGLRTDQFLTSLSYMAYGMGGIFIVVAVICLAIVLLNKMPNHRK